MKILSIAPLALFVATANASQIWTYRCNSEDTPGLSFLVEENSNKEATIITTQNGVTNSGQFAIDYASDLESSSVVFSSEDGKNSTLSVLLSCHDCVPGPYGGAWTSENIRQNLTCRGSFQGAYPNIRLQ
jgi:hypothetical protein